MTITPTTIYINVNVIIVVQSDTKANKGDYNIKHSSTGELVLLVMIDIIVVYIYNIFLKSCMILQHFEQNRVAYNPISVKTGGM